MIEEALRFIRTELNNYLNNKITPIAESRVELGNVAKLGDAAANDLVNKIVVSLINIEEDRISKNPENFVRVDNKTVYKNPKIHLNIYCLFSVNRESYSDALKQLSFIIQFFQHKNVFTHEIAPGLDAGIDKLIFDLYSLNFEQVNHLWGTLGGKYLPSVLYKMRMITIDEGLITAESAFIKEIGIQSEDYTNVL
ncbi:MAG: DUF4255 domain-containing protein [Fimbriimonadaceae bacterium]|nr:DUF4255 domain-containing protein [Chitinophagales bacterium]